ncbi:MAG: ferrochelatase [bacterium]|nr:ferrochelatase [bacterium]
MSTDAAPAGSSRKTAVMIVHVGTPDAPTPEALKRYLREFLSDRRVIQMPRILWWPILHGIILRRRPKKSAALYERVWDKERGDSPLRLIAQDQVAALAPRFAEEGVEITYGMGYGRPAVPARMQELVAGGVTDLLVLPLFPQYSKTTTESVKDTVKATLRKLSPKPAIHYVPSYHEDADYIAAIAASVRQGIDGLAEAPEKVLVSFHGIPKKYVAKGDPYPEHCKRTTELLRVALGMDETELELVFQSRFGRTEWIEPYADKRVEALARSGCKRIAVVTPGFSVDCLETIDEIGVELRETFIEAGGEECTFIPCLNDSPAAIDLIETLIRHQLP